MKTMLNLVLLLSLSTFVLSEDFVIDSKYKNDAELRISSPRKNINYIIKILIEFICGIVHAYKKFAF